MQIENTMEEFDNWYQYWKEENVVETRSEDHFFPFNWTIVDLIQQFLKY